MSLTHVAFSRDRKTVIDFVRPDGRTQIDGSTLDDLRGEYPDVSIEEFEIAYRVIEACFISPVRPVSYEQFIEALEELPPLNWVRAEDSESFKAVNNRQLKQTASGASPTVPGLLRAPRPIPGPMKLALRRIT